MPSIFVRAKFDMPCVVLVFFLRYVIDTSQDLYIVNTQDYWVPTDDRFTDL